MRITATLFAVLLLAACAKADAPPAADTMAGIDAQPSAISLADVAGRWNVSVMGEQSDSILTTYVLDAKADTAGWTFTFPNREPIPMQVTGVAGDSVMTAAGPFQSSLRSGSMVSITAAMSMRGDTISGITIARYPTTAADSVVRLRTIGTRAQ